jgi:hypothetical protein
MICTSLFLGELTRVQIAKTFILSAGNDVKNSFQTAPHNQASWYSSGKIQVRPSQSAIYSPETVSHWSFFLGNAKFLSPLGAVFNTTGELAHFLLVKGA